MKYFRRPKIRLKHETTVVTMDGAVLGLAPPKFFLKILLY